LVALVVVMSNREAPGRFRVIDVPRLLLGDEAGSLSPGQERLGTSKPQPILKPGSPAQARRLSDSAERTSQRVSQGAVSGHGDTIGGETIGSGLMLGDAFGASPSWYLAGVQSKIWSAWVTQVRPDSSVPPIVEFTILRDGTLGPVDLVQSSGIPLLDIAAKRAVYSASPFAALPRDVLADEMRIRAVFKPS
jgi:TonB family protein